MNSRGLDQKDIYTNHQLDKSTPSFNKASTPSSQTNQNQSDIKKSSKRRSNMFLNTWTITSPRSQFAGESQKSALTEGFSKLKSQAIGQLKNQIVKQSMDKRSSDYSTKKDDGNMGGGRNVSLSASGMRKKVDFGSKEVVKESSGSKKIASVVDNRKKAVRSIDQESHCFFKKNNPRTSSEVNAKQEEKPRMIFNSRDHDEKDSTSTVKYSKKFFTADFMKQSKKGPIMMDCSVSDSKHKPICFNRNDRTPTPSQNSGQKSACDQRSTFGIKADNGSSHPSTNRSFGCFDIPDDLKYRPKITTLDFDVFDAALQFSSRRKDFPTHSKI